MPHVLTNLQGQVIDHHFPSFYLSNPSKHHCQNLRELSFQLKYLPTITFPSFGPQIPVSHLFCSWSTEHFHDLSPNLGVWLIVGFYRWLNEFWWKIVSFLSSILSLVFKSTLFLLMKLSHSKLPPPLPLQRGKIYNIDLLTRMRRVGGITTFLRVVVNAILRQEMEVSGKIKSSIWAERLLDPHVCWSGVHWKVVLSMAAS